MRLTLRTMLAYMDDILEPEDAADIGKKLEESELAKSIMHRLRDSIRRLRLGAPAPLGNGMGLDPNSVAEYLDNTLPADQVGEFEKICLESDTHLAEVGSCHQILTLVLGEPAEVDAASRERMYHLAARMVSPQTPSPQFTSPVPAASPAAVQTVRRARPEVPEYLRESRSRSWVPAAVIAVLVVLCGGIATVVLLPEVRTMIAGRAGDQPVAPPDQAPPVDAQPPSPSDTEGAGDLAADTGPDQGQAPDRSALVGTAPPSPIDENSHEGDAQMAEGDDSLPDVLPPADGEAGAPVADADNPTAAMPAGEGPPGAPLAPPAEPPAGQVMGRYLYKQDVLLRLDRRSQPPLWNRLPATPSLAAGDQLMALSGFRPTINLIAGVTIQPVDAARFELLGLDGLGIPSISLDYGRFVLFTAGKPHNPIQIRLGDHQAVLTFVDGESTLAIEVRRQWIAGRDPTAAAGPLVADLFVTSGAITWEERGASSEWRAPHHAVVNARGVQSVDTELPKWTRGEPLARVDLLAAEAVEHGLTGDQPVSLSIKELLGDRRREVRELAIRAAANVGEFDTLVKMLNDPEQKLLWQTEIDSLRAAMARDPETAKSIQAAFETRRGADAKELFHMLWGYSAQDVADGAMSKLVEDLNNDEWLDVRVLAIQNLYEITGKRLLYKPDASRLVRLPSYKKWKERLKDKDLKPGSGATQ